SGLSLTVTGDAEVDATSAIDVSGRGYADARTLNDNTDGNLAAGQRTGGSHGGFGAGGDPGVPYGDVAAPLRPGAGGGKGALSTAPGGFGGGQVRLSVAGALVLDGLVAADGADAPLGGNQDGGGGAGGALL